MGTVMCMGKKRKEATSEEGYDLNVDLQPTKFPKDGCGSSDTNHWTGKSPYSRGICGSRSLVRSTMALQSTMRSSPCQAARRGSKPRRSRINSRTRERTRGEETAVAAAKSSINGRYWAPRPPRRSHPSPDTALIEDPVRGSFREEGERAWGFAPDRCTVRNGATSPTS